MSDKANKSKPLAEWIAAMFGSTAFRDGFGGQPATGMPNEAVIRAMGCISQRLGPLPPMAMETFYGQTMRHEKALRRAYEKAQGPLEPHAKIILRFGAALAVRSLAGHRYTTTDLAEYAELLYCRREKLQAAMYGAEAWYSEQMNEGLTEFGRLMRDPAKAA